MAKALPQSISVRHESGAGAARRAAKALAQELGFDAKTVEEIALAVIELATNLVKYGRDGQMFLTPREESSRVGMEVMAQDSGPGMPDVERALTDGFSTSGSRGMGLGAVNRLMDQFDIESRPGAGTRIVCRKWRRNYPTSLKRCPLEFGVASRPRTFGTPNGDSFIIKAWAASVLVGVIDGLGHGQFAHRAAQTARQYVENHFDQPLDRIFGDLPRLSRHPRRRDGPAPFRLGSREGAGGIRGQHRGPGIPSGRCPAFSRASRGDRTELSATRGYRSALEV